MYGDPLATYYYDAFGNVQEATGTFDNPYRYAGYMYDEETGTYYLMARFYDPENARFLQADDPKYTNINDPLTLNLYTYCHNEPIMYDDPMGHWEWVDNFKAGWEGLFLTSSEQKKEDIALINKYCGLNKAQKMMVRTGAGSADAAKYVYNVGEKAVVGTAKAGIRIGQQMGEFGADVLIQGVLNPAAQTAASILNLTGAIDDNKYNKISKAI